MSKKSENGSSSSKANDEDDFEGLSMDQLSPEEQAELERDTAELDELLKATKRARADVTATRWQIEEERARRQVAESKAAELRKEYSERTQNLEKNARRLRSSTVELENVVKRIRASTDAPEGDS